MYICKYLQRFLLIYGTGANYVTSCTAVQLEKQTLNTPSNFAPFFPFMLFIQFFTIFHHKYAKWISCLNVFVLTFTVKQKSCPVYCCNGEWEVQGRSSSMGGLLILHLFQNFNCNENLWFLYAIWGRINSDCASIDKSSPNHWGLTLLKLQTMTYYCSSRIKRHTFQVKLRKMLKVFTSVQWYILWCVCLTICRKQWTLANSS